MLGSEEENLPVSVPTWERRAWRKGTPFRVWMNCRIHDSEYMDARFCPYRNSRRSSAMCASGPLPPSAMMAWRDSLLVDSQPTPSLERALVIWMGEARLIGPSRSCNWIPASRLEWMAWFLHSRRTGRSTGRPVNWIAMTGLVRDISNSMALVRPFSSASLSCCSMSLGRYLTSPTTYSSWVPESWGLIHPP